MGRSVWAKEDCSGSLACPPPLCSLPTWSSSSGCLHTLHIFPFTMFVSPGLCGGVQQLRLVDLHRHHLSFLLRAHTDALCLCLAIGELDFLSFGSQTQVRAWVLNCRWNGCWSQPSASPDAYLRSVVQMRMRKRRLKIESQLYCQISFWIDSYEWLSSQATLLILRVVVLARSLPHWIPVPLLSPVAAFIPLRLLQKQDLNHQPAEPNLGRARRALLDMFPFFSPFGAVARPLILVLVLCRESRPTDKGF